MLCGENGGPMRYSAFRQNMDDQSARGGATLSFGRSMADEQVMAIARPLAWRGISASRTTPHRAEGHTPSRACEFGLAATGAEGT